MKINELKEKRARLALSMEDLTKKLESETRGMTGEESSSWDKMVDEFNGLDASIRAIEKSREFSANAQFETADNKDLSDDERHLKAFSSYLRNGIMGMEQEDRSFLMEKRAQSTGTNSEGAFLTHSTMASKIDEAMKAFGGMREVAEIINTDDGSDLLMPTFDDTANTASITDENTDVGTDDVAFGQTSMGAFMYTSGVYLIPIQLLQDSKFDIEGMISKAIGTRIARKQNTDFTVGNGTNKPSGIMTGITSGLTSAISANVGYDDLVDLQHSVDSAYRGNARFMFNDTTLGKIRKLKDGNGMPLWGMKDLVNGSPETILGKGYTINNDMVDIAAGAKPIVFGDLSKYMIRDVQDTAIARFGEKYMDKLQVGLMGYRRSGGAVWDAGTAFKALTIKA